MLLKSKTSIAQANALVRACHTFCRCATMRDSNSLPIDSNSLPIINNKARKSQLLMPASHQGSHAVTANTAIHLDHFLYLPFGHHVFRKLLTLLQRLGLPRLLQQLLLLLRGNHPCQRRGEVWVGWNSWCSWHCGSVHFWWNIFDACSCAIWVWFCFANNS